MPNWCNNEITVQGSKDDLTKMVTAMTYTDEHGSQAISLVQLFPMPEALENSHSPAPASPDPHPNWKVMLDNGEMTEERYNELVESNKAQYERAQMLHETTGYYSWWDWQLSNWGIKWGDCETHIYNEMCENPDGTWEVGIKFDTPWGPFADAFFTKISQEWNVKIANSYEEPNMAFYGFMGFTPEDGLVYDQQGEYPELEVEYDPEDPDPYFDADNDRTENIWNDLHTWENEFWKTRPAAVMS